MSNSFSTSPGQARSTPGTIATDGCDQSACDRFTVTRIAAALGRDVRGLRDALRGISPDGQSIVSGNPAKTYLFSSLPEKIRTSLTELAQRRGFDSPERMLGREEEQWAPDAAIADILPSEVAKAKKRALALSEHVRAYSFGSQPVGQIHSAAIQSHRALVGYEISPAAMANIFRRAITRDGGREEFDRWELYLPENPRRIGAAVVADAAGEFGQVNSYIDGADTTDLTLINRGWVWTAMCDNLQFLLEDGKPERATRRRLDSHVFKRASWMSSSRESLAKCFVGKWARFCAGDRFVGDRRPNLSGNRRPAPLTKQDEEILIARALHGGMAKAWRGALEEGVLSSAVCQYYISNPSNKSYVPQRVRALVSPQAEMLEDIHHGPRQAKLQGAHIKRDWSGVAPGDWYQSDDCTLPVYYWEIGPDGHPRAIRGQFLPMIDVRTRRAFAFALHCDRNYNAKVIRGLILRTHDVFGLPRRGFYFENGIWKKAKLLKGSGDEIPGEETERGLRDFVTFRHAQLPRGKVIERILGILQTEMEDQPGYVGRNEQTERFERIQRKLQLAARGEIEYSSFLLHREQWVPRLEQICDKYNSQRQDGTLKGLSPREAWDAWFDFKQPLVRLEGPSRFLLANHRRPLKVTKNGIPIQIGNDRYWFRNHATGGLIGHVVQVYFDPDDLSSICVRRSDGDSAALVVPQAPAVPAMDATPEQLSGAIASCQAHNRPALTLYGKIATHFPDNGPSLFRRTITSSEFTEETQAIVDQQQAIRDSKMKTEERKKKLTQYQRTLGKMPGSDSVSEDRRMAAYKLIQEATRNANP